MVAADRHPGPLPPCRLNRRSDGSYSHRRVAVSGRSGCRLFLVAWAILGLSWTAGCVAGSDRSPLWGGAVDTLSNGAVLVQNPEAGVWEDGQEWRLVEQVRIGAVSGEGAEAFGELYGLAVGADGRIYLLDRATPEVRVFSASGEHLTSFGRSGQGPGELAVPAGLALDGSERIWVFDPGAGRYSVFSADGSFVSTEQRSARGFLLPWGGRFDREGRLIDISGVPPRFPHVRIDPESGETEEFQLPPFDRERFFEVPLPEETGGGNLNARVPFSPERIHALDAAGRLWLGESDRYRLVLRTLGGDTARIVERDVGPPPVTQEDRERALEGLEWFTDQVGPIDTGEFPDRKPFFSGVLPADDGHLWVARYAPAGSGWRIFDVFDPEGRYLGEMQAPIAISPHPVRPVIQDGYLNAVVRDELDVQYFVRFEIVEGGMEARDTW